MAGAVVAAVAVVSPVVATVVVARLGLTVMTSVPPVVVAWLGLAVVTVC